MSTVMALKITKKTCVPSEEFPWGAKNVQINQIESECFQSSPTLSKGEQIGDLCWDWRTL